MAVVEQSVAHSAASVVRLSVYGEAACPDTKQFVLGALATALSLLEGRLQVEYVPFGNSYYQKPCPGAVPAPPGCSTSVSCLFNASVRDCYFDACGKGSEGRRPSSCFAGAPSCQHGAMECLANRVQACAGAPLAYVQCYFKALGEPRGWSPSGSSVDVYSVGKRCTSIPGTPYWADIRACINGSDGDLAVAKAAQVTPSHPGVPYAAIDGVGVRTDSAWALVGEVCMRLPHPLPTVCNHGLQHGPSHPLMMHQTDA